MYELMKILKEIFQRLRINVYKDYLNKVKIALSVVIG